MVAAAALLAALVATFAVSAGVFFGSARAQDTTGSVLWSVDVEGVGSGVFREVKGLETA